MPLLGVVYVVGGMCITQFPTLVGCVKWHIYQFPTPPFKLLLFQPGGGGSDSGATRFCKRGPKRGSEATERGGIFFILFGYENDISCTLNAIIRCSLCTGIPQFPTLFLLYLFCIILFFTRLSTAGPGPPCAPLSYASDELFNLISCHFCKWYRDGKMGNLCVGGTRGRVGDAAERTERPRKSYLNVLQDLISP